jgi:hypothetical protein
VIEPVLEEGQEELETNVGPADAILSPYATSMTRQTKTMQIPGMIDDKAVMALVDCGSTHTFLDPRVLKEGGYSIIPVRPMLIEAANGGTMISNSICKGVKWSLQGYYFTKDFRLLEINGYDLILGLDWLEEWGSMNIDWKRMQIAFKRGSERLELKAGW